MHYITGGVIGEINSGDIDDDSKFGLHTFGTTLAVPNYVYREIQFYKLANE